MVQVLALETTTEICSVTVGDKTNTVTRSIVAPRKHNEIILEVIDEILKTVAIAREDLDFVAFSAGPGSFTGVRLGAAIAQGIALGLDIEVIPIPTSQAMAHRVHQIDPQLTNFTIMRQSRRGWFYRAQFCVDSTGITLEHADELIQYDGNQTEAGLIFQNHLSLSALEVHELAIADPSKSVASEFAVPIYVEGDSPYRQAAR